MGGVSDVEAAVEELANALGSKITLLPIAKYGASAINYSLPVINVGEWRTYEIASSGAVQTKLPSGGRYIAMSGAEVSSNKLGYDIRVLSGGSPVTTSNMTFYLFYFRVE